jgi:retron-type reverse transcriptase
VKKRYLLHFYTTQRLSQYLGYPEDFLLLLANQHDKHYYVNPNRVIKGKSRIIAYPDKWLKNVLKTIDKKILDRFVFPKSFKGGLKGSKTINNAKIHLGQNVLIKLDIKQFYPSIKPEQVYKVFLNRGFSKKCALLISKLSTITTPHPHLPQGFPPSPKIALLILENIEKRLYVLAKKYNWNYTFWVDDITISGNFPIQKFKKLFVHILNEDGFNLNETKYLKNGVAIGKQKKVVTGIIINDKISPSKEKIKFVKKALYIIERYGIQQYIDRWGGKYDIYSQIKLKNILRGRINYIRQLNKKIGDILLAKFNKIPW